MKHKNKVLKKFKLIILLLIVMLVNISTQVLASEENIEEETPTITAESIPYIEMRVKTKKINEEKQVLVECWASNLTKLEGINMTFIYDGTKVQPSYVSGEKQNQLLEETINGETVNLDSIKYDKMPTLPDPNTGSLLDAQEQFYIKSKALLSNSFEFKNGYENQLNIQTFKYLSQNNNIEGLQFAITTENPVIDAATPILLGTFSFKQMDSTINIQKVEGIFGENSIGVFSPKSINIMCYNDPTLNPETDEPNFYDKTLVFTYEKYGSLSGTIELGYDRNGKFTKFTGKKVYDVRIGLYELGTVSDLNFESVGGTYRKMRTKLKPLLTGTKYSNKYRFDKDAIPTITPVREIITSYDDVNDKKQIEFQIDEIEPGAYLIFIDREDYGDYIIKNLQIEPSENVNLNDIVKTDEIQCIRLLAGDLDKTGRVDQNDKTILSRLLKDDGRNSIGYNFFDINGDGKGNANDKTFMTRILANGFKKIKNVILLDENNNVLSRVY